MVTTTFSLADMRDFAGPDANHHTDPDVAAAAGLPAPILQGVQVGPLALDLLEQGCGDLTGRWVRSTYLSHIFSDRPVLIERPTPSATQVVQVKQAGKTAIVVEATDHSSQLAPRTATNETSKTEASQRRSNLMSVPTGHGLGMVSLTLASEWIDRLHRASKAHLDSPNRQDATIHPGLLMQAYYWLFERRVEQDGLLHARQDFRWFMSPEPGDALVVTGMVSDRYSKRGRPYVVVGVSTRHAGTGELISESFEHCTWKSTTVSSGACPTPSVEDETAQQK